MTSLSDGDGRAERDPLLNAKQPVRREAQVTYRVRRRVDVGVFEDPPEPSAPPPHSVVSQEDGSVVPPPPVSTSSAGPNGGAALPSISPEEPQWMPGHEPKQGGGALRWLTGRVARFAVVGVVLLGAGIWGAVTSADRDSASGAIVDAGALNVDRILAGDCLDLPDQDEFDQVHAVPCSQPHDAQVYWLRELPEGDFPGLASLDSMAETQCDASFASTLPPAIVDDLDYGYTWFTPTETGWRAGDRVIKCLVGRVDGSTVTGSLLPS